MTRPARPPIVAAAVALCALVLLPTVAQAGTYKMYSCEPPGVNIAHPTQGPWRLYSENNPGTQNVGNCGAAAHGSMAVTSNTAGTAYHYMVASSRMGFELPAKELNPKIAILRVKSWAATDLETQPYDQASCVGCLQLVYAENLGPNASAQPTGGSDIATGFTSPDYSPPAPLHRLGLFCGNGAAGNPCNLLRAPNLSIAGTEVDLVESALPTGTIDGGALASAGTKAGSATLSYSASDGESGIERVEVLLDGVPTGAQNFSRNLTLPVAQQGSGACTYTGLAACETTATGDIAVDTTKVPDGAHGVTLRVIDAAGNRKDVAGPQITVGNGSVPGAPSGSGPGAPNGASASRLARITARFATTKRPSLRMRYGSRPTIRGKLVDEHGQPISGATIAVLQRPRRAGARPEQIDAVQTAADGTFSYKLAGGPSRTLTLAYSAFTNDPKPAATSSLATSVRAIVSAGIRPRALRAGGRITLTGRLNLLGREGVEVKLQGRNGRRWQTVDTVKTTRGGKFRWRYRFSRAAAGRTYAFRVKVDSPVYPFAAGTSKVIFVRVR
jgi:hypothetical protein